MSASPATILIVDDELRNRKLLELLLQAEGYLTVCAANGADALGSISRQPPDLILLDIMMPEMDGYEVAAALKAGAATSNIPIIMVTAQIDRGARLAGLDAGAEEFLTKPVDRAELSIRVRNLLRLKVLGDLLRDHNSMLEEQVQARTATLREAIRTAEQANRAKSEFLANMSHEIRTPMNAVVGLAYLMGQTSLDERQMDILAKTKLASSALLGLLNNVLDLSKIEAGELIVENTVFDLKDVLAALGGLAVAAQAKAITFEIDAPHTLPTLLCGDATRLAQILSNLITNAVKFTEHGGVTLRVRQHAVAAGRVTLCFTVQDTGIGIAAGMQQTIFRPFVQADSSVTRRFGGTGLGLSIVKRLATLMGGTVELRSTPGVGSEFKVMLSFAPTAHTAATATAAAPDVPAIAVAPAVPAIAVAPPAAVTTAMHGPAPVTDPLGRALKYVRVLIVDDSDINREVARRILELHGAHVEIAADGLQAVDRIRSGPPAFDVVLMDIQMPVLDGHEATRRIRGELRLPHLPVIAFTAAALDSHRLQAIEAGMNDYLVKPFEPETLVNTILSHVKPAAAEGPLEGLKNRQQLNERV